jgi:hypothetical protein
LAALHESLQQLATHNPPLVRELPRQAGMREQRFGHLLCGEPALPEPVKGQGSTSAAADAQGLQDEGLRARVEQLEQEVTELHAELAALRERIGSNGS